MWILIAIVGLIVLAVGAYIVPRHRYYGRMFSEANFRAFHSGLSRAVDVAQEKSAGNPPNVEDGSAFMTDAGLAVGVTAPTGESGQHALHISMSQPGARTTHAVCSRFGFFAVAMLGGEKVEITPYFTESGVHHLVIRSHPREASVLAFDEAHSVYLNKYRAIPFEYQEIGSEPCSTANNEDASPGE